MIMETDCVKLAQDFIHDDPLHKAFSSITGRKSIHSSESLKFYNEIGCKDKYVTAILQNGLRLPFIEQVPPYEEENNKSALENIDFLREKVSQWEKEGYVKRVLKKPYCTNPLSVAQKVDLKSGKIKLRPCLDLSRHVNLHLLKSPTKLADLDTSAIFREIN